MRPIFYSVHRGLISLLVLFLLATLSSLAQNGGVTTTQSFSYTGQIETFTVPVGVTSLTIEARGAQGGGGGGRGAIIRGTVAVTSPQTLSILVGQNGGRGGGGGGSFVVRQMQTTLEPLVVAGGGGGKSTESGGFGTPNISSPTNDGQSTSGGGNGAGLNNSGGEGGQQGNGGKAGRSDVSGSGGGGLLTDGQNANGQGGKAFVNGGAGGAPNGGANLAGGFGGGGGAAALSFGGGGAAFVGGGGGGYSGGGGGSYASARGNGDGGGGGSYNAGTNQVNLAGANSDNGLVSITYVVPQPIRYVKPIATGRGDGTSWDNASGDLQSQINIAGADQVWVAGGIYFPTTGTDKYASFSLKSGVAVYGGFAGGESSLTARPPVNPVTGSPSSTTLSGDIGIRGNNADNSYIVLDNENVDATARLDGVVISGGNNTSISRSNFGGAGILNYFSSPTLANCLITQNTVTDLAGAGLSTVSGSPNLINCVISGNSVTGGAFGGGLYNNTSSLTLTNCIISGNTASQGGGLWNVDSSPILTNCLLSNNSAGVGGAIYSDRSNPRLVNCTLTANRAGSGAALRNVSVNAQSSAHPVLTNCILYDNQETANTAINSDNGSGVTANYCLIQMGETDFTGTGNLVATTSPFAGGMNYQLSPCSAAINAGTNSANSTSTDLAGDARVFGDTIDIGAYEYQGIPNQPVAITQQPASGSAVCVGSTVTAMVSASGTSPTYQWYKDGQIVSGQTSATLTLTNVQPANIGSYSAVITGTCPSSVTSTAFSLTVTSPQPPTLVTRSGGPYPAGVSSLTIAQNVGDVILTTSGCPGGTLTWAGGMATTLAVSTASTGTQTFTATCTLNGCTSPAATATVTVVPTSLRVLQRDPDNGQLGTNTLKPYLLLQNIGTTPIPYSEITVRYWLTVEDPAPLMAQINSQLGSGNVRFTSVPVRPTRQGADTYLEFSFTPGAGSLGAMSNSGELQISVLKENYSGFNQGDDYSYVLNRDLTLNPRITAYRNGTIIFGTEPGGVVNAPLRVTLTASPTTITTAGTTTLTAMATGGTGPYLYTFTGPGTIVQTGNTATVTGLSATIHTFTVQVTDLTQPANQTASAQVSVRVNPAPPANTAPVATANNSQTATVGQLFTYTVNAFTDAETPNSLTYSATISPTNGFSFDPATRVVSGTPTATGVSSVTVTATDLGGLSASTVFTITVSPAPVVVTPLALTFTASPTTLLTTGTTTLSAAVSGGTPGAPDLAYRYTFSGPGTLTQTGNTATAANLPAGVQTFTVMVTDATQPTNQTITGTVSVTVSAVAVATQLTVLQRDPDNGQLNTNTLKPYLQLRNDGTTPIPYPEITVRYWLTVENPAPIMYQIGSQLGNGSVRVNYVSINPLRPGATGYLEFSFAPGAGSLGAMRNSGDIQVSATKQDYSAFNQGDDYSYVLNRDFAANPRITAYRNGQLIFGTEPATGTRLAAEEAGAVLHVRVLGNPVSGSSVGVEVSGAEGQALRYELTDINGRVVSERQVAGARGVDQQTLCLEHQPAGLLLLRVSTPSQSQTVKVLRQ